MGLWEILQYEFMRNALAAGIMASVACGVVGALVVTRRISMISGGISHAAFGGIGLGFYLKFNPILGALIFTIISALSMGIIKEKTGISEDSAIGILWVTGMSLGIVLISLTPGYTPNLFSYLFGSILTVPHSDLIAMLILDIAILLVTYMFYERFLAVSFDEDYAEASGIPVQYAYLTLLLLVALTVVILIRIVGVILIIAMLTIPATIAWQFSYKLKQIMIISFILSVIFTVEGLWLSYMLNLPSGATIVLVSVATLILSSALKRALRK